MAILQQGPRHKLTKLHNYTNTKYQNGLYKQIKAATKLTLAMYSNICLAFNLIPNLCCSNDYDVPCKFAEATRNSM